MPDPQTPRFGELLHRLLNTRGYGQSNVLDDFFPTIDLLSGRAELLKLRDERSFLGGSSGIGAVGLGGRVWCMNKTPGQLAVVDGIILATYADSSFFLDMTTIGLPADGAGGQASSMAQDSRFGIGTPGTTPASPVTFANDTSGVASGVPFTRSLAGQIGQYYPVRFVLRPGYALVMSMLTTGVGSNFICNFQGWARAVETGELT